MELKEFISQALKDILDAVLDAQTYGREKGARVNPQDLPERDQKGNVTSVLYVRDKAHEIEFDIAVTATEGTEKKGGIGVVTGILALGGSGQTTHNSQNVSRIKFSIPVVLPTEKH